MNVAESYIEDFKSIISNIPGSSELVVGRFPSPIEMIKEFMENVKKESDVYFELLLLFLAVILVSALIQNIDEKLSMPVNITAGIIVVLAVGNSNLLLVSGVEEVTTFIRSFVPIFAAVTALSGKITLSTIYGSFSVFCIEIFSELNMLVIQPLIEIIVSTSALCFINSGEKFASVSAAFRKIIMGILCGMSAIILGLMSLNGFVASGTDGMLYKAGKLFSGAAVPVIGGTLSSSYETVTACFSAAASIVGAAGIFVIVVLAAPTIIRGVLFWFVTAAAELISVFFENDSLKRIFEGFKNASLLMLASCFFELLVLIIGLSIMMLLKGN